MKATLLLIYAMVGLGCAIRADDDDGPALGRICMFLELAIFWPVVLGSLIAKGLQK